jgi:hypothetical protein
MLLLLPNKALYGSIWQQVLLLLQKWHWHDPYSAAWLTWHMDWDCLANTAAFFLCWCLLLFLVPSQMMYMKPSGRMERQNVAGDLKAMGGDAAVAASLGYGYGIQVDAQQQQQQQQQARAAAAAGVKAGGSHHHHQQQQQHKGSSSSDARAAAAAAAKHKASSGSGGAAKPRGDPPIILVPSGMTAMINVFNARQFFEEGRFITT